MEKYEDFDEILNDFIKRHSILLTDSVRREAPAIYWTITAKNEIGSALHSHADDLITEPTWGLLLSMLDSVFEHVEGSLIAFITGSPASAEVIARTAVESSVNAMYILDDDRVNRLFQYFIKYINQERNEIKQWSKLVTNMNPKEAHTHNLKIQQKRLALDVMEEFINDALNQTGSKTLSGSWPKKIYDRFKHLGLEISYRTEYAAMSSQTHNDAEDLINYFYFVSLGDKELLDKIGMETVNFSRLLMYAGVHYYLEAISLYAKKFELDEAFPVLMKAKEEIDKVRITIPMQ